MEIRTQRIIPSKPVYKVERNKNTNEKKNDKDNKKNFSDEFGKMLADKKPMNK